MIDWENVSLTIGDLPRRRYQKRVNVDLMEIVGATWEKGAIILEEDETSDDGPAPCLPGRKNFSPFRKVLGGQLEKFRAIKGYKAIGILDEKLKTVASDFSDESLDLEAMVASFKPVFKLCSKITLRHGFSDCRMFTVHTGEAVVQIQQSKKENEEPFFLIGVTEAAGNWFFVKFELENLERQLIESLKKEYRPQAEPSVNKFTPRSPSQ
jgi:hypothetical protein